MTQLGASATIAALLLVGCGEQDGGDGTLEKAGERVDETIENVADEVEDAADEVEERLERDSTNPPEGT